MAILDAGRGGGFKRRFDAYTARNCARILRSLTDTHVFARLFPEKAMTERETKS